MDRDLNSADADTNEYFGSDAQIKLMHRAGLLWELLKSDPDYSFSGRMVELCNPVENAFGKVVSLARLQGATGCQYYPADDADNFCSNLHATGLTTSRYEQFWGGEGAYAASTQLLDAVALPDDLNVIQVDTNTPATLVAELAKLSLSCGVMQVPGRAMRGQLQKGVCLLVLDGSGKAIATASSYMSFNPSSSHPNDAFWGMLATHPDRRGEKIGALVGAMAIVHMWENHGARGFTTGIKADNSASMAMCKKLGVVGSNWTLLGVIDTELFGDGAITK